MKCSCVYIGDYDQPEFHRESLQKAIKSHRCDECGKIIKPGEKYEYSLGKWDGIFGYNKTCLDCLSIRNEFFCEGFFYGQMFKCLHEHLNEIYGQVSSDCLLALTPAAMTKICGLIDDIWEDKYDENP